MTTEATTGAARFMADGQLPPDTWGAMRIDVRPEGLWAEFPDPDHEGPGSRPSIRRPLALITGSHHQQVLWYETGRGRVLGRFPLTYLIAERRWVPRGAAFLQPPAPVFLPGAGQWNQVCISCHTTRGQARVPSMYVRMTPEAMAADSRVGEFGVACEACHGPAGAHADAPRAVPMPNPRRLDPRRSAEVCGQCHSVWEWHDTSGEQAENAEGPRFRPGDELARTRFVAQPGREPGAARLRQLLEDDPGFVREAFWPDGTIAVAGREYNGLIESACFVRGGTPARTMSCVSCHALHQEKGDTRDARVWADDQLSTSGAGDGACLTCHPGMRAGRAAHTRHAEESPGSQCVNCHMPHTTYGLLKTVRSHRITSPDARVALETGRPDACSLCHVDKPLAWTARHLTSWYGRPAVPATAGGGADDAPAAIRWALSGDAQQRAVAAAALGRAGGSGADAWTIPALALLLDDPYPAVRFIAARSLRVRWPAAAPGYDFLASRETRRAASRQVQLAWRTRPGVVGARVPETVFDELASRRDDRPVALRE